MSIFLDIWHTAMSEFSDISDIKEATVITLRLSLAALLGAAIGYERERSGKDAGLRTHWICIWLWKRSHGSGKHCCSAICIGCTGENGKEIIFN